MARGRLLRIGLAGFAGALCSMTMLVCAAGGAAAEPPGQARLVVRAWLSAGPCGAQRADGPPCTASSEPAAQVGFEIRDADGGKPRARATADADGRFVLIVPPGRYVLGLAEASMNLMLEPVPIRLDTAGDHTLVIVIEALRP